MCVCVYIYTILLSDVDNVGDCVCVMAGCETNIFLSF